MRQDFKYLIMFYVKCTKKGNRPQPREQKLTEEWFLFELIIEAMDPWIKNLLNFRLSIMPKYQEKSDITKFNHWIEITIYLINNSLLIVSKWRYSFSSTIILINSLIE